MDTVKEELAAQDIDFVYVTDTSSDSNDWVKIVAQHAGDHYIVPKEKMQEMQIPDYDNAIPHYLIYDRKGKFVKAISGWPGKDNIMLELRNVEWSFS